MASKNRYQDPHWIYHPRSGSRIIAQRFHEAICVVRYGNGSQHVVGGVKLSYRSAEAKRLWRDNARRLSEQLVNAYGGISWDNQGEISIVVPFESAIYVSRLFEAVSGGLISNNDRVPVMKPIVDGGMIGRNALSLFSLDMIGLAQREDHLLMFYEKNRCESLPLVVKRKLGHGKDLISFIEWSNKPVAISSQIIPANWSMIVASGLARISETERGEENVFHG